LMCISSTELMTITPSEVMEYLEDSSRVTQ
jgi:hypothetical protein